jgi:hypothetical protein
MFGMSWLQVREPQTVYDTLAAQVRAMQADLQDKFGDVPDPESAGAPWKGGEGYPPDEAMPSFEHMLEQTPAVKGSGEFHHC